MQRQNAQETGWEFVATREAAPEVFAALLRLDVEDTYTMTELAESADVPMKTLYVDDWLDDLCDLGVLATVDSGAVPGNLWLPRSFPDSSCLDRLPPGPRWSSVSSAVRTSSTTCTSCCCRRYSRRYAASSASAIRNSGWRWACWDSS
ncbi:MAG: hypothetical protein ABEI96_02355 [Haloarculaceae archaeon]